MGQCPCTNIAIMVEGTSVTALIKTTDTACINTLVDLSEQAGNEFEFLEVRAAKEVPLTVQILVQGDRLHHTVRILGARENPASTPPFITSYRSGPTSSRLRL